jgi:hypothetical protein
LAGLPKVLTKTSVTDEELTTILTNVEAFLNSRPLTYVSSDVADILPLTSSHFLIQNVVAPPVPTLGADEVPPFRKKWKLVQSISNGDF